MCWIWLTSLTPDNLVLIITLCKKLHIPSHVTVVVQPVSEFVFTQAILSNKLHISTSTEMSHRVNNKIYIIG